MKSLLKSGFTLIELLVVITIIGILATGATTVYTSQIQKARDTTRITSIKALQSGIEQVYQDAAEYPSGDDFDATTTLGDAGVQAYVPQIPSDPKAGQNCNNGGTALPGTTCHYVYEVNQDANGISNGSYEISAAFENTGNITSKAAGDGGLDDLRLEFGLDLATNVTSMSAAQSRGAAITGDMSGVSERMIIDGATYQIQ